MNKGNDIDLDLALQEVFTSEEQKQLLNDVESLRSSSMPHPSLKARLLSQTDGRPRSIFAVSARRAIAFCCLALLLISRPLWEEETPGIADHNEDYVVLLDAFAPELFAEDYLYFEDRL